MDNVTHTLIGALLGETAARSASVDASCLHVKARRTMFLTLMIVGSNLPDADVLYSAFSDNKLDYLLEHRGHTHTVIGALLAAALLLGLCALWLRWRRVVPSAQDRAWLAALAFFAPLLHLAMDYTNSYGVHPWWPFDNRWFYGDSVFIIEPLFWAAAAPLAFVFRRYVARGVIVLALLAGLYLALRTGLVPGPSIGLFGVLSLTMLALGRFTPPKVALFTGIGVWIMVTAVFALASRQAAQRLDSYAAGQFPRAMTLDRVLTPLPMSPYCWDVILIQTEADRYVLRQATLSLAPTRWARCPTLAGAPATAPLTPVSASDAAGLEWRGEIDVRRERLRQLVERSCEVAALVRFARAPWISERKGGPLVGDLRYDREPELGFAEIDLAGPPQCPAYVPPWTPPRSDLLR